MGLQRNDVAVSAGLTDRKYREIDESYGFYKALNFRLNNLISRLYDGEETYLLASCERKFHSCFLLTRPDVGGSEATRYKCKERADNAMRKDRNILL